MQVPESWLDPDYYYLHPGSIQHFIYKLLEIKYQFILYKYILMINNKTWNLTAFQILKIKLISNHLIISNIFCIKTKSVNFVLFV